MNFAAPAMLLTAAATLLAVLVTLGTAILVARTRRRVGIQPPVMTGSPDLECALRVQGNTIEQIVMFLPALWLATIYFQGWAPGIIGFVWSLGRIAFAIGYKPANPGRRGPGFGIGIFSTLALVALAAFGIFNAWSVA